MGKYFLKYPKSHVRIARKLRRDMTEAERKLWSVFRNNQLGVHFRRQVPFGSYVLDFLAIEPKLAIEVDGAQHYTLEGKVRDAKRDAYLRSRGIKVLRFLDTDVLRNREGVVRVICEEVQKALFEDDPTLPSPERGGGCLLSVPSL